MNDFNRAIEDELAGRPLGGVSIPRAQPVKYSVDELKQSFSRLNSDGLNTQRKMKRGFDRLVLWIIALLIVSIASLTINVIQEIRYQVIRREAIEQLEKFTQQMSKNPLFQP